MYKIEQNKTAELATGMGNPFLLYISVCIRGRPASSPPAHPQAASRSRAGVGSLPPPQPAGSAVPALGGRLARGWWAGWEPRGRAGRGRWLSAAAHLVAVRDTVRDGVGRAGRRGRLVGHGPTEPEVSDAAGGGRPAHPGSAGTPRAAQGRGRGRGGRGKGREWPGRDQGAMVHLGARGRALWLSGGDGLPRTQSSVNPGAFGQIFILSLSLYPGQPDTWV